MTSPEFGAGIELQKLDSIWVAPIFLPPYTVSCPISGHFLQNCNILTQNSTNELKFSHNVASTSGK